MFVTETNEKIGEYISALIKGKYKYQSDFCREWIKLESGYTADESETTRKGNKLSQIIKGVKGIQITDLAYFCELLDVTCEEILSAGESFTEKSDRYSNYRFAFTQDSEYWEKCVNRGDGIMLNTDEYGMTVIDYALQFKNYKLLKYLKEKGYIWFVDESSDNYESNFSAGTKIIRKQICEIASLPTELKYEDRLRTSMAALAIENNDIEMLEYLRARDIPELHSAVSYSSPRNIGEKHRNRDMTVKLAGTGDTGVLDYFTQSFVIENDKRKGEFVFPFIGELIKEMLNRKSKYTEYVLKKAVGHNRNVLNKLKGMITEEYHSYYNDNRDEKMAFDGATQYFRINEDGILTYILVNACAGRGLKPETMISNIIQTNGESENERIKELIQELNGIYGDIKDLNMERLIDKR